MKSIRAWVTKDIDRETFTTLPKGHQVEILHFTDDGYAVCHSLDDGAFCFVRLPCLNTNKSAIED